MQGISPNRQSFREIHLENICESSCLRGNSLRGGEQGIFSCTQGIISAFSTGPGKFANYYALQLR
jgi:hypothetical protein